MLYSAGDAVRDLAASGELSSLHERCADLSDSSERLYVATRDRLQNVLQAAEAKEDDVYESLVEDHELEGIRMHESGLSLSGLLAWARGGTTVENLNVLSKALPKHADSAALTAHQTKLHALLGVKAQVLESLLALQRGYVANVNGDAAARDDLSRLEASLEQLQAAQAEGGASSESAQLLSEQLAEINSGLSGAQETFESLNAATAERNAVFENFTGVQRDNLNQFRLNLVHHLSS